MKLLPNGTAVLDDVDQLSQWVAGSSLEASAQDALAHVLPLIKHGDTVVDAGAALGDHTCAYLRAVGPNGTVYAFEPNPLYFDCLVHNCPGALLFNAGLGSEHGTAKLYGNPQNQGASTLAVQTSKPWDIEIVALDDLHLERVNLIKMDIEGSELVALMGALNTIERCRPILSIEMNEPVLKSMGIIPGEIYALLENLRYQWRITVGPDLGNCDILCEPLP